MEEAEPVFKWPSSSRRVVSRLYLHSLFTRQNISRSATVDMARRRSVWGRREQRKMVLKIWLVVVFVQVIRTNCQCVIEETIECHKTTLHEVNSIRNKDSYRDLTVRLQNISHLPEKAFDYPRLSTLSLTDGSISTFDPDSFVNLRSLIRLDLSRNSIESVDGPLFRVLRQLRHLDLSSNSLVWIDSDVFKNLRSLQTLSLASNALKSIQPGTFDTNVNIESIDLSKNNIRTIGKRLFYNNQHLARLDLDENLIQGFDPESFQMMNKARNPYDTKSVYNSRLLYLSISRNNLTRLRSTYFSPLTNLETLNLTSCRIRTIEPGTFTRVARLNVLDLSDNEIESFPDELFDYQGNLETMILNDNPIRSLNATTFKELIYLLRLEMRSCLLSAESIDPDAFKDLNLLDKLDLTNNRFVKIPDNFFIHLKKLTSLSLRSNKIDTITAKSFEHLERLQMLDLSGNCIRTIGPRSFFRMIDLTDLYLQKNSIVRLDQNVFESFHEGYDDVSSPVYELDLSDNRIEFERGVFERLIDLRVLIAKNCSIQKLDNDLFKDITKLEHLDLSDNAIEELPEHLFLNQKNLIRLYLGNNHLVEIPVEVFRPLSNMEEVILSNNHIKHVDVNLFNIGKVYNVYLDHNELVSLPGKLLQGDECSVKYLDLFDNNLTFLEPQFFNFTDLELVVLGNNPWNCECLEEIIEELYTYEIKYVVEDYFDGKRPVCIVDESNVGKCERNENNARAMKEKLKEALKNYTNECKKPPWC